MASLWVADITYVPTLAGFLFLAVVMDVFSRRTVGWAMGTHLRTELILDALNMAIYQTDGFGGFRPVAVVGGLAAWELPAIKTPSSAPVIIIEFLDLT